MLPLGMGDKRVRGDDLGIQLAGQPFEPIRDIDRVANDCELEALPAPNIAQNHRAIMKADSDPDFGPAVLRAHLVPPHHHVLHAGRA